MFVVFASVNYHLVAITEYNVSNFPTSCCKHVTGSFYKECLEALDSKIEVGLPAITWLCFCLVNSIKNLSW